jgi:hypothetical protein
VAFSTNEVKLSPEILKTIYEGIREDRDAMIRECRVSYPLKTFQDID